MFKTISTALVALSIFAPPSTVQASDFYQKDIGNGWSVHGDPGNDKLNPACYMQHLWNDGSNLQLIYDLKVNELRIFFQDMDWDISDPPGTQMNGTPYSMRINFYSNNNVTGGDANYELVNKNTIVIGNIDSNRFLPDFSRHNEMRFIMGGTIKNATVSLAGVSLGVTMLGDCIQGYKKGTMGTTL